MAFISLTYLVLLTKVFISMGVLSPQLQVQLKLEAVHFQWRHGSYCQTQLTQQGVEWSSVLKMITECFLESTYRIMASYQPPVLETNAQTSEEIALFQVRFNPIIIHSWRVVKGDRHNQAILSN